MSVIASRLSALSRKTLISAGLLAFLALPLHALEPPPASTWPDTLPSRLSALAYLQALKLDLSRNPSATLTLDKWCAAHRLAPEGSKIVAERVPGVDKAADSGVRKALKVTPDEPVRYRRVKLRCGDRVLSEADNWYVPALLTPEMNQQLDSTDTSFGRVVQPLAFRRQTLSTTLLWEPVPAGWEMKKAAEPASDAPLPLPPFLLEQRAILTLPDGTPFSVLVETYTNGVLAFPLAK
ncbi:hypothetical protein [Bosea sp. 117]|uniref:hypothetical protein n=1 Tax=Bosea sp. 117 TaxID=1125973 RepID=UPI000493D2F8|nr:hypothetical protein [Bosea sp. 117]